MNDRFLFKIWTKWSGEFLEGCKQLRRHSVVYDFLANALTGWSPRSTSIWKHLSPETLKEEDD